MFGFADLVTYSIGGGAGKFVSSRGQLWLWNLESMENMLRKFGFKSSEIVFFTVFYS